MTKCYCTLAQETEMTPSPLTCGLNNGVGGAVRIEGFQDVDLLE